MKCSSEQMILLYTTLSKMMSSGSTTYDCALLLKSHNLKGMNKKALDVLEEGSASGDSLSEIFHNNEKLFGKGIWQQISSGELSGRLPETLERLCEQVENSQGIRKKIMFAMSSPAFTGLLLIVVMFYMFLGLVPGLRENYISFGSDLPELTLASMAVVEALWYNWYAYIPIAILIALGIRFLFSKILRLQWHEMITEMPVVGKISKAMNYANMLQVLRNMIEAGASQVDALEVALGSVNNAFILKELQAVHTAIMDGGLSITEGLFKCKSFDEMDKILLEIGSRSGSFSESIGKLCKQKVDDTKYLTDALVENLSGPMVIILGLGILFLSATVLYPIYNLTTIVA